MLAWHAVLFEIFPVGSLNAADAADLTNAQAIERLPEKERPRARAVLDHFCAAFNESFPIVETIHECNPNPFLYWYGACGARNPNEKQRGEQKCKCCGTSQGDAPFFVDLGGYGTGSLLMSPDQPVSFSLPRREGVSGETAAPPLCTLRLLEELQAIHNRVVERLSVFLSAAAAGGGAAAAPAAGPHAVEETKGDDAPPPGDAAAAAEAPVAAVVAQDALDEMGLAPQLSYTTPGRVRRRKLIYYDRRRHLLPLLNVHAVQGLGIGSGHVLDFDLGKIEAAVAETVLGDKGPIYVAIRNYSYAGEMNKAGRMAKLPSRIPQEPLPPSIIKTIRAEVDTQARLSWLMAQLEGCLNFVLNVGGAAVKAIDGDVMLRDYVTETLMVPLEEWDRVSTRTLTDNVRLRHLQSLFMSLEESLRGNPVDQVRPPADRPTD